MEIVRKLRQLEFQAPLPPWTMCLWHDTCHRRPQFPHASCRWVGDPPIRRMKRQWVSCPIPCQSDRDDLPGSVDPFLYVILSTTVSVLTVNPHPCQISLCAVYYNAPHCLLAGTSRAEGSASPPTLAMMVLASRQEPLLAET